MRGEISHHYLAQHVTRRGADMATDAKLFRVPLHTHIAFE
jgi:hypothetical protein